MIEGTKIIKHPNCVRVKMKNRSVKVGNFDDDQESVIIEFMRLLEPNEQPFEPKVIQRTFKDKVCVTGLRINKKSIPYLILAIQKHLYE